MTNLHKKNHTCSIRFVAIHRSDHTLKELAPRKRHMRNEFKKVAMLMVLILFIKIAPINAQIKKINISPKTKYTITGFAHGFPDSTLLYLEYGRPGTPIDSCKIIKGKFSIQTIAQASESHYVVLRTKDFKDYKFFWIEKPMTYISGLKGNFPNAVIHNSPAQEIFDEYLHQKIPLYTEIDSLRRNVGVDDPVAVQRITILEKEIVERTKKIIARHPNTTVSAYLLWESHRNWGKKVSTTLYSLLQQSKSSAYAKEVKQFIDLNKDIQIGDDFTDIKQKSPEGNWVSLSNYKGKWILLEFWASWCGPCRKDNPDLVKTYATYKDKGFEIVAVSIDANKEAWIEAIKKDQLTWIHMSDLQGGMNTASLTYGVFGIPDNFLISPDGKIVARNLRGGALNKKLKEIFSISQP